MEWTRLRGAPDPALAWPIAGPGLGFLEGPVWVGDDLLVTSFSSGLVFRLHVGAEAPRGGEAAVPVSLAAIPGGGPNGLALGPDGTLYVAQSGGKGLVCRPWPGVFGAVQAIRGGVVSVLTPDPVSPNDLCFGPDGQLYVTDPTRGTRPARDGRLWRVDPETGAATLLVSEPYHANGLIFDAAGALYVADTFGRRLVRYEPRPDGWLAPGETFAEWEEGWPDGLELDEAGRFMVCLIGEHGAPAHLLVLDTDGHPVDRLAYPGASDEVTNIARRADGLLAVTDSTTGTVLLGR